MKMTKYLLLITLLFSFNLYGASAKFAKKMGYELTYKQALKKAQDMNKPIMMVISTKTCPWCRKLENQTLKKSMVHNIVSKNFVPVTLNRGDDIYPKQFKAKVVPTVFFIDPKTQKTYYKSFGYKNQQVFKGEPKS